MHRFEAHPSRRPTRAALRRGNRPAWWVYLPCALVLACGRQAPEALGGPPSHSSGREVADEPLVLTAEMQPKSGSRAIGTVQFRQLESGEVEVKVAMERVDPRTTHGFHIHELGDCSADDASSAGGHFNPDRRLHGLPPESNRHAGDLGNLVSDGNGRILTTRVFDSFQLEGERSVVGRAVILHADADEGSQPSGNAGARIACGVIEGAPDR